MSDVATGMLFESRVLNPDEAGQILARNANQRAAAAPSYEVQKGMEAIGSAKTYGEAVDALWNNKSATLTMLVDSLFQTAPTLGATAVAAPLGALSRFVSTFGASGSMEYAGVINDVLNENGVDLRNPSAISKALSDPKVLEQMKDKGMKRGLVVGLFDGLTAGIASSFMRPAEEIIAANKLTGMQAKKVAAATWAKELSLQMAGGAGGEFAAQQITGENKPADVIMEALAEGLTAPAEVISAMQAGKAPPAPAAEVPPQAPPPEPPQTPPSRVEPFVGEEPPAPAPAPTEGIPGIVSAAETIPESTADLTEEEQNLVTGYLATGFSEEEAFDRIMKRRERKGGTRALPPVETPMPPVQAEPKLPELPSNETAAVGMPTVEVPLKDLTLSKDVPQFKMGANEKGVVEPLGGKFERTGVAPIQVWRRNDGSLEVISGRHRLDLARRSGETTIPAQIHDEAQGFTPQMAAVLDAELNIRDGQGKVKDYVNYFKASGITPQDAESRGLLARATGKRAFTVASQGSDELIAAVRNDQVPDEAAYFIALNAPNDSRLQGVGLQAVMDGKSANIAVNTMQAVKALGIENNTTTDMFGFDDSALKEAQAMAQVAARKQREIQTRLSAISGAAKNPAIAKAEGIDIRDPNAVNQRIQELRQMKAAWDNWSTNPDLIGEIRQARGVEAPSLTLRGETEEEIRAREEAAAAEERRRRAEEDAAKKAEQEAAERARAEQTVGLFELGQTADQQLSGMGDLFASQEPAVAKEKPAETKVEPTGAARLVMDRAQRLANAENNFRTSVMEQFGLTAEQADAALQKLIKEKLVTLNPDTGQADLKTGAAWDRDVMLRAAGAEEEPKEERKPGATDDEIKKVGEVFEGAQESQVEDDFEIHHLFDPPAKEDIVRLSEKEDFLTPEQAKAKIAEWRKNAEEQDKKGRAKGQMNPNSDKVVLSLFDLTGAWSEPWVEAGYQVYRFDIQDKWTMKDETTGEEVNLGDINQFSVKYFQDLFGDFEGNDVYAILAACPCTDFASSGARHFKAKDANGKTMDSINLVKKTLAVIDYWKPSIWAIENPVGRIEKLGGLPPWRMSFDPYMFGDPYTKKTLLWGRFNADLPTAPVEPTEGSKMHRQYGGKSLATKNARSVTPEGFAYAFFQANNAIDNPVLAIAGKYDRLDRDLIQQALDAGLTEYEIQQLVDDPYYFDGDDEAAENALRAAIAEKKSQKPAVAKEKPTEEKDLFGEPTEEALKAQARELMNTKVRIYASGMSAISDLSRAGRGAGGLDLKGVGVDVGELSANAINMLAHTIVNFNGAAFIDSGAFGAFRRGLKSGTITPINFDNVLKKYDAIIDAVGQTAEENGGDWSDVPNKPMLVMPDVVGDQTASLAELKKHLRWVKTELKLNHLQLIVPLQRGDLSLSDAYKAIVDMLGTDNFVVGIPSNAAAITPQELEAFLRESKPKAIHILGAGSEKNLLPRLISAINAGVADTTKITADASPIRSAVLAAVANGAKRGDAIEQFVFDERDPALLRDLERAKAEPAAPAAPVEAVAEEPVAPAEKPAKAPKVAKEKLPYTPEQRKEAEGHAEEIKGDLFWQKGDYALVRTYSLTGDTIYIPTMGSRRAMVVDVRSFTNKALPEDIKQEMLAAREQAEREAEIRHEFAPFIKFKDGIALSEDIPDNLAGVIRGWKDLLKLDAPIYVSTIEDARRNKNNFTGPHRRIGSGTINENDAGSMRRMNDGSYYILFTKSTSPTVMLEILGHELGHLHQALVFDRAPRETQQAIRDAHKNWLASQKGKTAKELVASMRGRATARRVRYASEDLKAEEASSYWHSFKEWYADQVSRWAVSAEAPTTIVEKFFKRLGNQLRQFYQQLKNKKYLPDETFAKYINEVTARAPELTPPKDISDLAEQSRKMVEPEQTNEDEDDKLLSKYNRPNTPMLDGKPLGTFLLGQWKNGKQLFKDFINDPVEAAKDAGDSAFDAVISARMQTVWFGAGLESRDFNRYGRQLRTSEGLAIASVALDNAIHSANIGIQVLFQGGLKYDSKFGRFVAVERKLGMRGVYEAEKRMKDRIGAQKATNLINGYLEAKRSISIMNELYDRQANYEDLKAHLEELVNQGAKEADIQDARDDLIDAQNDLKAIQKAASSVLMSEQEMRDFAALDKSHPELREIMKNFNAINQNLLRVWRDVGLLSEKRYNTLADIQDYVPWQRLMEDGEDPHTPLQSTNRNLTNIGREKLFKRGAPTDVLDFKAQVGQNTFELPASTVLKVTVDGKRVPADLLSVTEDGKLRIDQPIEEGALVVFKVTRPINNIIENMTQNVMRMSMNAIRHYAAARIVYEYGTRAPDGKLMTFPKVDKAKNRFNFIIDGQKVVVEISDPLVAGSIYGMENLDLEMWKPLAMVTNLVRRSITLSGAFQLEQVLKDAPTAAMVTGVKRPDLLIGGVLKGLITSLVQPAGKAAGVDIEPTVNILRAAGIGGFHSPSRTSEETVKRRIGVMNRNVYSASIQMLDHIGDSADMAQRVAVYKRVLAETGDEMQALHQAANVINFLHRGSAGYAQVLFKIVPFMSAYANATDVLANALIGGNLKGMSRAKAIRRLAIATAMLSSLTLMYCMLVGGDPDYEELDDQTKMRNIIVPGTKIKIPMNTSAAYIWKAVPEMLYNTVINEGTQNEVDRTRLKKALSQAAKDMLLGPPPIPAGVGKVAEVVLDHDFYTGRGVIPENLKHVEAFEQWDASTSELAKKLSAYTEVPGTDGKRVLSPIEADHLVRGLFGSVGFTAQWISNAIGERNGDRPELTGRETPVIGRFIRPEVGRANEDLFYDLKQRVDEKYQTWKTMTDRGDDDAADAYENKHEGLLDMYREVNQINDALGQINAEIRELGTAKGLDMTPEQRRKEITDLQREKMELVDDIRELRKEAGL